VTYGSTTPGVCSVSGSTVFIVAAGTCMLTADQPGDVAWNAAAQTQQSVAIAPANQILTFPAQTEPSLLFEAGATFTIAPEATSASPNSGNSIAYGSLTAAICEVNGTTVTMVGPGNCVIAANQSGTGNYNAAMQVTTQVKLLDTIFANGFDEVLP
jgi:hypothetical protein